MKCRLHLPHRRTPPAAEKEKTKAAERELDRVRGQWPAVLQAAAVLTAHRERNHFAESISHIFRGGSA